MMPAFPNRYASEKPSTNLKRQSILALKNITNNSSPPKDPASMLHLYSSCWRDLCADAKVLVPHNEESCGRASRKNCPHHKQALLSFGYYHAWNRGTDRKAFFAHLWTRGTKQANASHSKYLTVGWATSMGGRSFFICSLSQNAAVIFVCSLGIDYTTPSCNKVRVTEPEWHHSSRLDLDFFALIWPGRFDGSITRSDKSQRRKQKAKSESKPLSKIILA